MKNAFGYVFLMAGCIFCAAGETAYTPSFSVYPEFGGDYGLSVPGFEKQSFSEQSSSEQSSEEIRHPLFFAVTPSGWIALPDIQRNRILFFGDDGTLLDVRSGGELLSGRMNFFGIAGDGFPVIFTDGRLYCLDREGAVLWNVPFPPGVFPEYIYPGEEYVFFAVPGGGNSKGYLIPLSPPYEAGDASVRQGVLPERSPDMPLPVKARFMASGNNGESLWYVKTETLHLYYLLDEADRVKREFRIPRSPGGSWSWTVCRFRDGEAVIYLYEPRGDRVRIDGYLVEFENNEPIAKLG